MRLFLVRHFESTKNTRRRLSSSDDRDRLTAKGRDHAVRFADAFVRELKASDLRVSKIIASSSPRGVESARVIADALGIASVLPCDFLRSTNAGPYAGLSAERIARLNPDWDHAFRLYRAGLFNQYMFDEPPLSIGAEPKRDFESRVVGGLMQFISGELESLLVLANRSSIVAMLLYFARRYYGYPREFYGHIPISLGALFALDRKQDGSWEFVAINRRPGQKG